MIILTRFTSWKPDARMGILFIFALGTLSALALLLLAVYMVAQLLNLVVVTLAETTAHIATIYAHADSFTQLLMLCILGYCTFRLARCAYRSARGGK